MKVPLPWVNHYLPKPLEVRQMADALELAGVEVEAIIPAAVFDPKIVVGAILSVKNHPNADRLKVVQIDVKNTEIQIVTGAPNVTDKTVGKMVAVALPDAQLPDGSTIEVAELRGVQSHGMMCSQNELRVGGDHSGIMFLDNDLQVGQPIAEVLTGTDVIDTTTSANRWDLNGMVWLAHEIAAQTGQQIAREFIKKPGLDSYQGADKLEVKIEATDLVDRYMLIRLAVEPNRESPHWLTRRLESAGVRSINPVVDVTNYVMLEYGHPLHASDASKVDLPVTVRTAQTDEKLTTLDGIRRNLYKDDLMIADANKAIGFAGVMGGQNSLVEAGTTEILLEAASFNGPSLRKTALRHGLRTDASARFERGIPVQSTELALGRAIELLQEVAGARVFAASDQQSKPATQTILLTRMERINRVLGMNVTPQAAAAQLRKLKFEVETADGSGELRVGVPWWRPDIQSEDDLAEEIIKLIGYDKLEPTLPVWQPQELQLDKQWPRLWHAKDVLRSHGLFEVVTYSFISKDQITGLGRDPKDFLGLQNPLSSEQAYLRSDLLPSLLRVAERNRAYAKQFGLFEFSKVYLKGDAGALPNEPLRLGTLFQQETGAYRAVKAVLDRLSREFNVELKVAANDLEVGVAYPKRVGQIMAGKNPIGWIGQLHPSLVQGMKLGGELAYLEIDWNEVMAASQPKRYQSISRFPTISRDIAILIDRETTWQEVREALSPYDVSFISDYYGDDLPKAKKSLAFQLTLSYPDRTPVEADADKTASDVMQVLNQRFMAELRG